MRISRIVVVAVVLALIGALVWWRLAGDEQQAAQQRPANRPVNVEIATARRGAAPVELEAIGEIASSHSVDVRPQLAGTLTRVAFEEGQAVKKGQLLFEIDAGPYQAEVAQARAQLQGARATVAAARAQSERLAPLLSRGYVTPQEVETATAAYQQGQAGVKLAEAQVKTAEINLGRTRITAPIAGRTGALAVRAGNLLGAGDAAPLVTIRQLQPVLAEFSVPQGTLPAVRAARARGPLVVNARLQEGGAAQPPAVGELEFVDNTVDEATGTVRLKARFANAGEELWPGAFVTLLLTLGTQPDAVLVPEGAVQQGADGAYVFLVGPDGKAQLRNVTVDRQLKGEVVLAKGLSGGERLVVRPPRDLKPGAVLKAIGAKRGAGGAAAGGTAPVEGGAAGSPSSSGSRPTPDASQPQAAVSGAVTPTTALP